MNNTNKIKTLRRPADALYRQQKLGLSNKWCNHPQRYRIKADIINYLIDEIETHEFCSACSELIN